MARDPGDAPPPITTAGDTEPGGVQAVSHGFLGYTAHMATTRAQLVEALLAFPARDRADAARELLESLDGTDDPVEVETAWREEIARRVQEIETHAVDLEDGPAVMKRLRERARHRLDRRRS